MSIIITHEWEFEKDSRTYIFHLIDNHSTIIESYEPFSTNGQIFWSPNGKQIVVGVDLPKDGYLIHDIQNNSFAWVKNTSMEMLNIRIDEKEIIFEFPKDELDRFNGCYQKPFGRESNELPIIKYEYPKTSEFVLKDLKFYPREILKNISNLSENEINLYPIKVGYLPFDGILPQNTYDGYNGRDFEVYQLEEFADYGDPQSIEWLNQIKNKVGSDYNKWAKVSEYLGLLKRI